MAETDKHGEKTKVICVNVNEEIIRLLYSVKNKSEFIREAVKDKFIYEKFRDEYTNLKGEIEDLRTENDKLKTENEKIKTERKHYEEKIKEEPERTVERQKEENKALHKAAKKPKEVKEEKKPEKTELPKILEKNEIMLELGKTTREPNIIKVAKEEKEEKEEITGVTEKPEDLMKEKETENKKISESDIIKGAKEIYNKYKKYGKSAIKITKKYLQKRGINDTGKINEIIEAVIKNTR
ncbi:MAG: hypothetical protein GW779_06565 [Candidatus Altiarchaeum hamiconexum]|uniref:Uncharacterized protein n=1 Tax=Candidatus Altarchaeum hamiconexum TaxID=1803513 RepID=A0A8J7YZS8_9ARCH|nr:hypothetical protein [Candidatus Altarchaeum hamiconexum]PIV28172.1 MAG: hypothetical protein COS36_03090 [Candidatus Altarchaeum sp. CG03_land_8_20_14_0_80_32_618]PIX48374.1 MAG: hypothetical protein COZ53_04225 [Candidatus Altarchaeum sp. CG_4_8_14_3_um_filter_33_2054]PIZ32680.1 MAG: hypothetical protein COY41_00765 [Candidatus Altarchaeum sp. CG_4_10_14_0_8_um_filter_32_851]PJC15550.1 MAG: hypothetical protein CO063_00975 [Candidatus Altarchaeum sp. CG_4_9_14_0_8_um_filter_32_206]